MPEVTITLTISVPEGATVAVDSLPSESTLETDVRGFENALRWMEDNAPAPQQRLQQHFLSGCTCGSVSSAAADRLARGPI